MMHVRPIRTEELAAFTEYSDDPQHNHHFAQYVSSLWAAGTSRPDWCFVAEDSARILGRLLYWAPPDHTVPALVDFLDVSWTGDYLTVGVPLLRETLNTFRLQGATDMRYLLDLPSPFGTYPDQRIQVLEAAAFPVRRHGQRWEWNGAAPRTAANRLRFRPITEVGEDILIDALVRAMEGTLDQGLQQDRQRLGAEGAAHAYLTTARSVPGAAATWRLAYTNDSASVGIVMPSANDGGPIIDFLGVVPEQRGRGYGSYLLAYGIAGLHAADATRIRSDADRDNLPMAATFQRAGFRVFRTRLVYWIDLSNTPPGSA